MDKFTARSILAIDKLSDELAFLYSTTTPKERFKDTKLRERAAFLWWQYAEVCERVAKAQPDMFVYPYRGLDFDKLRPVFRNDGPKAYRRWQQEEQQHG